MDLHRKLNFKHQELVATWAFFVITVAFAHEDHSKVL